MRLYISILTLLMGTLTFAQELKKQKIGNEFYQEEFSILKSNKKIRHGEYRNYKLGKLNIEGQYDNNKKVGVWKYYQDGDLVQSFNHSKNVVDSEPISESKYLAFVNNNYEPLELQVQPTYTGGKPGLEKALNDVMTYPIEARTNGIEGSVMFSVIIDENGKLEVIEILNGHIAFHSAIKEALSKIDQSWIVGSNGGENYRCKLFYTLEFKLLICGKYGCSTIFVK